MRELAVGTRRMNVDEALLLADDQDQSVNGRGLMTAVVVLAEECRRLYALQDQPAQPPQEQA